MEQKLQGLKQIEILIYIIIFRLSNEKENKLTEKLIDNFTREISLAFLYMDDGSLAHSDKQQDRATIAICDYNEHDSIIIQKAITNLGVAFYTKIAKITLD